MNRPAMKREFLALVLAFYCGALVAQNDADTTQSAVLESTAAPAHGVTEGRGNDPGLQLTLTDMGLDDWMTSRPIALAATKESDTRDRAGGFFFIGSLQFAREEYDRALETFNKALEQDPKNPEILNAVAETYLKLHQPKEAVETTDRLLVDHPKNIEGLLLRADALADLDRKPDAVVVLETARNHSPNNKRVLEALGVAQFAEGRLEAGIQTFEKLIAIEPSNIKGLFYLSFGYKASGRIDDAIRMIDNAIDYAPSYRQGHEVKIEILAEAKRWDSYDAALQEAIIRVEEKEVQRLIARYNQFLIQRATLAAPPADSPSISPSERINLAGSILDPANAPFFAGRPSMAVYLANGLIPAWQKFADNYPTNARPRALLGNLYELADRHDDAVATWRTSLPLGGDRADVLRRIGRTEWQRSNVDLALEAFEEARSAAPFDTKVLTAFGDVLESIGEWERVTELYEQGIRVAPGDLDLHLALARVLTWRDKCPQAIDMLNHALGTVGDRGELHHALGQAFLWMGDYSLAARSLRRAVDRVATEPAYRRDVVLAHLLANDLPSANKEIAEWKQAIQVERSPYEWQETIAWLVATNHFEEAAALVEEWVGNPSTIRIAGLGLTSLLPAAASDEQTARATALLEQTVATHPNEKQRPAIRAELLSLLPELGEADAAWRRTAELELRDRTMALAPLADAYRRRLKFGEALAIVDEALQSADANSLTALKARRATLLMSAGKVEEGRAAIAESIAASDNKQLVAMSMASELQSDGHYDEAEKLYRISMSESAVEPLGLNNLAFLLAKQGRHLDEAEGLAKRAVRLTPGQSYVFDTMGIILVKQGRPAEAMPWLRAALARAGILDPEILGHLADAYDALGRHEQAKQWRDRATRLDVVEAKRQR